ADVPASWRRLEAVGLHSKQTGMDNVRGVCGCPVSGVTPHELVDAAPVIRELSEIIVGNHEFTNLPRKFNVTITGCLENCCHTETQDVALVPAYRELNGQQVNGFNVLVGGKQGSGGYRPASSLDVFVEPADAARVCAEITRIFRDHGSRASRVRARLAFLVEDRGITWVRAELACRIGAFTDEPILKELQFDPSPIMRGLVCCTGNDYCGLALIETKGWAIQIAQELERRTAGRKLQPLTMHWSGCPAGCGMHQVGTIG